MQFIQTFMVAPQSLNRGTSPFLRDVYNAENSFMYANIFNSSLRHGLLSLLNTQILVSTSQIFYIHAL
jgi:hypothetical protein